MDHKDVVLEQEAWFSTYGILTYKRILEKFKIKLGYKFIVELSRKQYSLYSLLIQSSAINVFNSIIFQQASDYQIYVQKIIIDYQLSEEAKKDETMQGANVRAELESERKNLVSLNAEFQNQLFNQEKLIFNTQKNLKKLAEEIEEAFQTMLFILQIDASNKDLIEALRAQFFVETTVFNWKDAAPKILAEINAKYQQAFDLNIELSTALGKISSLTQKLQGFSFLEQAKDTTKIAVNYRRSFYDCILKVKNLLALLPDHSITDKSKNYQEDLLFDASLGE